jgi:hypothetical protein
MWSVILVTVMAALTGFYMLPAERNHLAAENLQARDMAESMGIYRQAVVAYFSAHDVSDTSVAFGALKASGALPHWSALQAGGAASAWSNYRDSTGVIYIYPAAPAPPGIVSEVLKLSRNSMAVGVYRASDHSLYSPADGSRIVLTWAGAAAIPDAALVWSAARH